MGGYVGFSRVPDVVVHMSETHSGSHGIVDIQDGVDDVTGE